jgi:hypothetical protein
MLHSARTSHISCRWICLSAGQPDTDSGQINFVKMQRTQPAGRHKVSSERFDLTPHACQRQIPPVPTAIKQPDVLEWLEKVEFGPAGMWKASETMKISSALSSAHKKIGDANLKRADELRSRLHKSQERVDQLKNRLALADKSLTCLTKARFLLFFSRYLRIVNMNTSAFSSGLCPCRTNFRAARRSQRRGHN